MLVPVVAPAQQQALASWIALDAPVGLERRTTVPLIPALTRATGGSWQGDALGNLTLRKGSGLPRRVVACAIDRAGFAVTHITSTGMLRLHRVGNVAHPLWDQAHEGQQLEILTERGAVPAVSAIANGHFAQQHRKDSLVVTADDLWVDVGASSPADVAALGIRLLDPVQRRLDAFRYGDRTAGAQAGLRAGCAALVAAATGAVTTGETMFVISVQSAFGWPGVGGAVARSGFAPTEITLLANGRAERQQRWVRAGQFAAVNVGTFRAMRADSVRIVSPAVRHAGTLMESIGDADATWLLEAAAAAAGVSTPSSAAWVPVATRHRSSAALDAPMPGDPFATLTRSLAQLADLPGVPTHEWRVREAILAQLPAWARDRAVVDSVGNIIVSAGPARDTVVFMAHMDEVAYHVAAIVRDGTVSLRERGGVINSAWEGQPAVLHFPKAATGAPDTLMGVFVPRDSARVKNPRALTAWFGLDSAALVARGVRVGLGVTSPKVSVRLFGSRFTGRSMDDRAGSTALLMAVRTINPASLNHAVLFVWSVQEEGGLVGAQVVAASHGASTTRIYSIDTFVSSNTPLESPHFAFAPLGNGPVLRAIENGSISPPTVRAQVQRAAAAAGIPLQIGLTQGGTDGTTFTFFGAPNTGLSWPGRYSHTPAEVLDLRDLQRLARLIAAVAQQRPEK
ncbi:M20/M25/M40 family metallo-hydrolase [Gemmatimonas phototrophica]|nr:M20/M25/M40 family metallo-hydrolase [Gemmatimonas phototrophica]